VGFCKFNTGKSREDIEKIINEGVYQVDKLKEEGLISNIIYDDEVIVNPQCYYMNNQFDL